MRAPHNVKLLAYFNFLCDFRLYGPFLVIYFAEVTGSYALAASVLSVTMLAAAVLEVPTGIVSDRLGRRGTAIAGALMSTAAVTLYAMGTAYWVLIGGALLEGASRALYSGNNEALLYDSLAEERRQDEFPRYAGRVGSMFQLALAISAVLGGIVAVWSLRTAVVLSIIPQALCILIALRMIEPSIHGPIETNVFGHLRNAFSNIRRNPLLRRIVVASSLRHGAGETAFQFQPVFVSGLWPIWAVGAARTGSNGLAFVSFWLSGRVIGRFGASKVLFLGEVWANLANVIAVAKPTVVSPALIAGESISFGTSVVSQSTLLQEEFSDRERATMGSLTSLLGSLVFACLAVLAGLAADRWGIRVTLLACQAIAVVSLPLYWSVHRRKRRS